MYDELDMIFSGSAATGQYASHMRLAHNEEYNSEHENDESYSTNERDAEEPEVDRDPDSLLEWASNSIIHTRNPVVLSRPSQEREGSTFSNGTPNNASPKRQRSTGEKMTEAILKLAVAHKTLAEATMARHANANVIKKTKADLAIKMFRDELVEIIGVGDRFGIIQLLANNHNAATMYYGMDGECRLVQEFLAGNTQFS